jgi:hypothetical protein
MFLSLERPNETKYSAMKSLFTLIASLFFFAFTVQAQEVIYQQDFSSQTATQDFDPASFGSAASASWAIVSQELRTSNPVINNVYNNKLIKNSLQVAGYESVTVEWTGFRSKLSGGMDITQYPLTLTYTTNLNSQVHTAMVTNGPTLITEQPIHTHTEIIVPAGATFMSISINIDVNSKKGDYYAIDNLMIIGNLPAAPLPVELMYFKGAVQGTNASLTWATAQELDNEKFVVERSQDGKSFSQIGEVQGHGNSSILINYTFTDTNPGVGTNYYRLRQVDFSGMEETSNVVALQFKGMQHTLNGHLAKVYPTIAATEVNVSLALHSAQITVLNANGLQVAQYSNASQNLVLPVSHLQPGTYFIKVSDGKQQQTQRLVKK